MSFYYSLNQSYANAINVVFVTSLHTLKYLIQIFLSYLVINGPQNIPSAVTTRIKPTVLLINFVKYYKFLSKILRSYAKLLVIIRLYLATIK